ncbi:MAG: hypothetical protein ACFFDU_03550 [Candidatus Thorarchaeota archaeon]
MGTLDSAKVLTVIGILCNGFVLFFEFLLGFLFLPLLFFTLIWFFVGIILPMIAYNEIPRGNRGSAGGMLIIAGILSLIFIFLVGGVLLLVAGALVASWNPYPVTRRPSDQTQFHPLGPYHVYDGKSIWSHQPPSESSSTAQTKRCVNCGAELNRIDQYCHECGTHVGWY